jgi:hypothetical protein
MLHCIQVIFSLVYLIRIRFHGERGQPALPLLFNMRVFLREASQFGTVALPPLELTGG